MRGTTAALPSLPTSLPTWVNGIHPVLLGRLNDGVDVKVGPDGRLVRANEEGLIGFVPMLGEAVFFL